MHLKTLVPIEFSESGSFLHRTAVRVLTATLYVACAYVSYLPPRSSTISNALIRDNKSSMLMVHFVICMVYFLDTYDACYVISYLFTVALYLDSHCTLHNTYTQFSR